MFSLFVVSQEQTPGFATHVGAGSSVAGPAPTSQVFMTSVVHKNTHWQLRLEYAKGISQLLSHCKGTTWGCEEGPQKAKFFEQRDRFAIVVIVIFRYQVFPF